MKKHVVKIYVVTISEISKVDDSSINFTLKAFDDNEDALDYVKEELRNKYDRLIRGADSDYKSKCWLSYESKCVDSPIYSYRYKISEVDLVCFKGPDNAK